MFMCTPKPLSYIRLFKIVQSCCFDKLRRQNLYYLDYTPSRVRLKNKAKLTQRYVHKEQGKVNPEIRNIYEVYRVLRNRMI